MVSGQFMGQLLARDKLELKDGNELRLPRSLSGRMVGSLCMYKKRPVNGVFPVSTDGQEDPENDDRYRLKVDMEPPAATVQSATAKIFVTNVLPAPQSVDVSCTIKDYFGVPVAVFQQAMTLSSRQVFQKNLEFEWGKADRYQAELTVRDGTGYKTGVCEQILSPEQGPIRSRVWLNDNWEYQMAAKLFINSTDISKDKWKQTNLPHVPSWQNLQVGEEEHVMWFRRNFTVPPDMLEKEKDIVLVLLSAGHEVVVCIDRQTVFSGTTPYAPIYVDISQLAQAAEVHELIVGLRDEIATIDQESIKDHKGKIGRFENTISPPGRFGLGEMYLESRPRKRIDGVNIRTSFRDQSVNVDYQTAGENLTGCRISSKILYKGKTVFTFTPAEVGPQGQAAASANWAAPILWSTWAPELLCLESTLERQGTSIDVTKTRFGFREIWAEQNALFLNGTRIKIAAVSMARFESLKDYRNYLRMGKRQGLTGKYFMPPNPLLQDVNDEEGILSITMTDGVDAVTKQKNQCDEYWQNARDFTVASIAANRNHPSILAWSISNEWARSDALALSRLQELGGIVRRLDQTRFVFCNCDLDLNGWSNIISTHYPIDGFAVRDPKYFLPDSALWYPKDRKLEKGLKIPCGQVKQVANIPEKSPITFGEKPIFIDETGWKYSYNPPLGFAAILGDRAYLGAVAGAEAHHTLNRWFISRHRDIEPVLITPWDWCQNDHLLKTIPSIDIVVLQSYTQWYGGQNVTFHVNLHWDRPAAQDLQYAVDIYDDRKVSIFRREEPLHFSPAELIRREITISMPEVDQIHPITLVHSLTAPGGVKVKELKISGRLCPRDNRRIESDKIFLFDPEGKSRALLESLGVTARPLEADDFSRLAKESVLIVGQNAAVHPALTNAANVVNEFVWLGGKVFILSQRQTIDWLPVALEPTDKLSSICFRRAPNHPILQNLADEDVKFWFPHHLVSQNDFRKPFSGNYVCLLDSADGKAGMEYTPLVELPWGEGTLIASQLDFAATAQVTPASKEFFFRIIDYLRNYKAAKTRLAYWGRKIGPLVEALAQAGADFEPIPSLDERTLQPYTRLLVEAKVLQARDMPALKAWTDRGGTLVLHNAPPEAEQTVAELLAGNQVRFGDFPKCFQGRFLKSDKCPLLDGLSNEDFFWKKLPTSQNYVPSYVDPAWAKDEIVTQALTVAGGRNYGYPEALSEIECGRGKVIFDQLRWDSGEPSVSGKALRIVSCLLTNLGVRFKKTLPQNALPKNLAYTPIDISKSLNRGFADEVANDGKGGWTDQGKDIDMRELTALPGLTKLNGVPFRIEKDKSCLVLGSKNRRDDLPRAASGIPLGQRAEVLYFLQTGAWVEDRLLATYKINYADGECTVIQLIGGCNYRDWTDETPQAPFYGEKGTKTQTAFTCRTHKWPHSKSLYMMGWKNPYPDKIIQSFDFVGENIAVPILVAVTAGTAAVSQPIREAPPPANRQAAEENYAKAVKAVNQKDLKSASDFTAAALKADPTFSDARLLLARIFIQNNDLSKAAEELRKCLATDRMQYDAYLLLGDLLERQNKYSEALQVYEESLAINFNQPVVIESVKRVNEAMTNSRNQRP